MIAAPNMLRQANRSMRKPLPARVNIKPDDPLRLDFAAALACPDGSMTVIAPTTPDGTGPATITPESVVGASFDKSKAEPGAPPVPIWAIPRSNNEVTR
jgi:hypothetical protein